MEEERQKWEVHGQQLFESLAGLEEEPCTVTAARPQSDNAALAAQLETTEEEVQAKTSQLDSSEVLRRELVKQEHWELWEQQTEVAWWKSRETQLETGGAGRERPSTVPTMCQVSGYCTANVANDTSTTHTSSLQSDLLNCLKYLL